MAWQRHMRDLALVEAVYDWDWAGAEQEHKRAVLLNPSSAEAHQWYGEFLIAMGRHDEAPERRPRDGAARPGFAFLESAILPGTSYLGRRHDEAISQLNEGSRIGSSVRMGIPGTGVELAGEGDVFGSHRELPESSRSHARRPGRFSALAAACTVRPGDGKRPSQALARLRGTGRKGYVDPWYIAGPYDGVGDTDHSIECLQRAYNERSARVSTCLKVAFSPTASALIRAFGPAQKKLNFPS